MIARILSILTSFFLLAGLGAWIIFGASHLAHTEVEAIQYLVAVAAKTTGQDLQKQSKRLAPSAAQLAQKEELATNLRALTVAVGLVPTNGRVPDRLQARIDGLREQLLAATNELKTEHPEISGITLVDENSVVVLSGSKHFPVGQHVGPPEETDADPRPTPEGNTDSTGSDEDPTLSPIADKAETSDPMLTRLADPTLIAQQRTVLAEEQIFWLATAPVSLRTRTVGAVVLEAPLTELPPVEGITAFLVAEGKVILGKAPADYDVATAATAPTGPHLLTPIAAIANIPGWDRQVPFAPLRVDPTQVGVWGHGFAVPGLPQARGFAAGDGSRIFASIAGIQVVAILLLALIWLSHLLLIVCSGRKLRRSVGQLTDMMSRALQGMGGRKIPEKSLPSELSRLVRLLNQSLDPAASAAGPKPLAQSPTIDDVLQVQEVEEPPDVSNLEFAGITDSGSLGVSPPPPPDESDGYESLDDIADSAIAENGDESLTENTEELPGVPDALDALDHLSDSPDTTDATTEPQPATPPPAPPEVTSPETDTGPSGTPPPPQSDGPDLKDLGDMLDEYADDATAMMQLTPDLIATMRSSRTPPESPAAAEPTPAEPAPSLAEDLEGEPEAPMVKAELVETETVESAPEETSENSHYREVFDNFLATRKVCKESTTDLTFEKFAAKLEKSRAAVMTKHNCSDVRFQVYIKNGKAALKASPNR